MEMSVAEDIVKIACRLAPDQATLVPEKRREVTTEGGLDVLRYHKRIKTVVSRLNLEGINASLFINPVKSQIDAAVKAGAGIVELHTGEYANAGSKNSARSEFLRLKNAASYAASLGLEVNAGHGLDYDNVKPIASIPEINELNIGHSIIARAVFVGIRGAVMQMLEIIR
jgi:pyridoxine 5-phosphate synthase